MGWIKRRSLYNCNCECGNVCRITLVGVVFNESPLSYSQYCHGPWGLDRIAPPAAAHAIDA